MNLNSYEYAFIWAEGCSEMQEHPVLVFNKTEFEQVNTLAHKFQHLESEGYILCNWKDRSEHDMALLYCTITPKGVDYYRQLQSRKPWAIVRSKIWTLVYGAIAAAIGAVITLWLKK